MDDILIRFLWAIAPSIFVGVAMALFNRQQSKRNAREDKLLQDRVEKEMLELDLLLAASQLSYAVAMKQYDKAMDRFRQYERRKLAEDEA